MSSKGRGKPSIEGDRYYTPPWAVRQCMEYVLPFEVGDAYKPGFRILEPSAGGGAFVTKLRKLYPEATIHACDLDETSGPWPEADKSWYGDFIEFASETDERYDLICGNPPFELAIDFVKSGLQIADRVTYLLRHGIVASDERRAWMRDNKPHSNFSLAHRPRFLRGKKNSDSCDYDYITWRSDIPCPDFTITDYLPAVSKEERKILAHGVLAYEDGVVKSMRHPRLF